MAVSGVAIAGVIALYLLVFQHAPPAAPMAELSQFAAAVDDRDVDALVALWLPAEATDEVRTRVTEVFEQIGGRGTTPRIGEPRVRYVDESTYRSIHRIGEIDLEVRWVRDGERYRITAFGLAR